MSATEKPFRPSTRPILIAAVLIVLAALAVPIAIKLIPGLPDPLISHWGPSGPDDWQPLSGYGWTWFWIVLLIDGFTLLWAFIPGARRSMSAFTAGMAWWMAAFALALAVGQRGGEPKALQMNLSMLMALVPGVLAGGLVWLLTRGLELSPRRQPRPIPDAAPRTDVNDDEQVAWIGKIPGVRGVKIGMGVGAAASILFGILMPPTLLIMIATAVILIVCALLTEASTLLVDQTGLRFSTMGRRWKRIPLESLDHAETVAKVYPLGDFGGWGWRTSMDGRSGFVTAEGPALVVKRLDAGDLVVSLSEADAKEAAALINGLIERERS